ncbi:hypothetical protein BGX23_011729 [Mortierella sp. AD031]|nr:hypothetical protein BGX23_011729 [Mortierella sp. AD031]
MPTKRTFTFVFRGKPVEIEKEYGSDEEELINNSRPRLLWPDDGQDYAEGEDECYEDEERKDNVGIEPEEHHYDEDDQAEWDQQEEGRQTPPPPSPSPPPRTNYQYEGENDHDSGAYEDEDDSYPTQPVINRGYVSESIAMVQHRYNPINPSDGDDLNEEDDLDGAQDDTMYTALDDDYSDDEASSPLYSQEDLVNPFEYIPNPEEDRLLAEERERQRIASRDKLGIVGRGVKYPIPAYFLEAPSPTTTFGRTTLWPMQYQTGESSGSQHRSSRLLIPPASRPSFSKGPAFNTSSASVSSSSSSAPSLPPSEQLQPTPAPPVSEETKKERATKSTVVTRPANPDEIQAIYAAILGRRHVSAKDQEEPTNRRSKDKARKQNSSTGGSGSSLYGSEEEQEYDDKTAVAEDERSIHKEYSLGEGSCVEENLMEDIEDNLVENEKAALEPIYRPLKHHLSTDECSLEDLVEKVDDGEHENLDQAVPHICEAFDGSSSAGNPSTHKPAEGTETKTTTIEP